MDRSDRVGLAQQLDRALDLPPVAEVNDIADGATAIGPLGGLHRRQVPEERHQFLGLIEPRAIHLNECNQVSLLPAAAL